MMEFTREELQVVFHALCLAEAYYNDENRQVKGMHAPTPELVHDRLRKIEPLVNRITRSANEAL